MNPIAPLAPPAPPSLPGLADLQKRAKNVTAQGMLAQGAAPSSPTSVFDSMASPSPSPLGGPSPMPSAAPAMPFAGYDTGAQQSDGIAQGAGIRPGSLRGAPGVVKLAATQLGTPYVFGSENPDGSFDCSGLTKWAYSRMGVDLPHSADGQMHTTTPVDPKDMKPGMLLYFNYGRLAPGTADHVMIYAGDGRAIGAQPSTSGVGFNNVDFSHLIGVGAVPGVSYSNSPQRRTSSPAPSSPQRSSSPSPSPSPRPKPKPTLTPQQQGVLQKQQSLGRRI